MNAKEILKYGHQDVMKSIEGLIDDVQWNEIGVTPLWSIKDHIGHLAAFELQLADALSSVVDPSIPTPYLDKMKRDGAASNDIEAAVRKSQSPKEAVQEYVNAHERVMALAEKVSPELFAKTGTISWYGPDYSLEDFIVYSSYGHKQGHVAQIAAFRERKK